MMKKWIIVFLAAVLLVLSACSSNSGNDGSDSKNNTPEQKQPQENTKENKEEEKVTINWWNSVDDGAEAKALEELIQKYAEVKPNVTINRTFVPFSDIKNKLLISSVTEDLPDIVWMDNPDHHAFSAANIFADITEEVSEWGQADKYFEGPWSSTVFEGKNYGVPVNSNNLTLFYNVEMFKAANLTPPKTWDELKEAAQILTKDDVFGMTIAATKNETTPFQLLPWIWQAGGDLDDMTDMTGKGAIEAVSLWKEMMDKGHMSKEIINHTQNDSMLMFASGKAAMMVNGTWLLGGDIEKAEFEWDIVPLPSNVESATILGGFNWAITETSKHKKEAWEFIEFASQPENSKEFTKTAGRLPSRKDLIQDPFWQDNKHMKIFADNMEHARARAYGPNYPKISAAVQDMIQAVLTGSGDLEAEAEKAKEKITPLLP